MTAIHRVLVAPMAALSAALCCALALAACGLPSMTREQPQLPVRAAGLSADRRIAQLDFGRQAHFGACVQPACPSVTPKTLATVAPPEAPPAAPPSAHPMAATARSALRDSSVSASDHRASSAPRPAVTPHRVVLHFATDSAALTATHKSLLRGAIAQLRQADRLVIVGRTDNVGSETRNQSIALARALAIRDHVLDLAPDLPARISIDAKGRCCYTVPNETSDGRAQNRRVELIFTLPNEVRP